jgi:hypothetical protein
MYETRRTTLPAQLLQSVARQVVALVRDETSGLVANAARTADRGGKGLGYLAVGGLLGYVGGLFALAAVVELLHGLMPRWLASLLVGGVTGGVGVTLASEGIRRLNRAGIGPQQAGELLHEAESAPARPAP